MVYTVVCDGHTAGGGRRSPVVQLSNKLASTPTTMEDKLAGRSPSLTPRPIFQSNASGSLSILKDTLIASNRAAGHEQLPSPEKAWVELGNLGPVSPVSARRRSSSPAYLGPLDPNVPILHHDTDNLSPPKTSSPTSTGSHQPLVLNALKLVPTAAGIGLQFAMQPLQGRLRLVIADIVPGGPAARSSRLAVGDEIVGVGGQDCRKMTVGQVCSKVSGTPGSTVELMVIKKSSGQKIGLEIIRGSSLSPVLLHFLKNHSCCCPILIDTL